MNQALINAYLILGIMFLIAVFIIQLWLRHRLFVDMAIIQDGVLKSKGGRYRQAKNGKLYSMTDFFSRKPLEIENINDYFIITEGLPLIGIKKILNLTVYIEKKPERELRQIRETLKEMEKYNPKRALKEARKLSQFNTNIVPYMIPENITAKSILSDYTFSWALESRLRAHEDTEYISPGDMMVRFAVPIGLMILAALVIIFYPSILEAVRDPVLSTVNNQLSSWQEIVRGFR